MTLNGALKTGVSTAKIRISKVQIIALPKAQFSNGIVQGREIMKDLKIY